MRNRPTLPLVLTLVSAQFVVMLDSSILNVALPSIAADLGLTPVGTAWVLNAYFLTFGGLLLISGRAADIIGRRRIFLFGAGVLVAGSLLGGFATTDMMLVGARLVQGVGAAMLSPAAMSVILATFTGPARVRAMSGWGAASTVGARPASPSADSSPRHSAGRACSSSPAGSRPPSGWLAGRSSRQGTRRYGVRSTPPARPSSPARRSPSYSESCQHPTAGSSR